MLSLSGVKLKNWCQHKDFSATFSKSTNVIVGKNRAGKSNLIKAIVFGLLGKTSGTTIDENIAHGESSAKVSLRITVDSIPYEICRVIGRGRGATIHRGEDLVAEGVDPVNQYVSDLLGGVTAGMLSNHLFISQNEMNRLVSETPAERLKLFTAMIPEIEKVTRLHKLFSAELSSIPEISLPVTPQEVEERIGDTNTRILDIRSKYVGQKGVVDSLQSVVSDARSVLSRRDTAKADQVRVGSLHKVIAESEASILEHEARISNAEVTLNELPEDSTKTRDDIKEQIAILTTEKLNYDRIAAKASQLELQKSELATLKEPKPPECGLDPEESSKAVADAEGEIRLKLKLVDAIDGCDGPGVCPLCGANLDSIAEILDKCRGEVELLTATVAPIRMELDKFQKAMALYERNLAQYNRSRAVIESRIDIIAKDIDGAGVNKDYSDIAGDIAVLRAGLTELDALIASNTNVKSLVADSRRIVDRATVFKEQAEESLSHISKVNAPSSEDVVAANTVIGDLALAQEALNEVTAEGMSLKSTLERLNLELTKVKALEEEAAKLRAYKNQINICTTILGKSNLPTKLLMRYMGAFERECNTFLGVMNTQYAISIDEDAGITCVLPDGYKSSCNALSGGQLIMLSLASHLALNTIFASKVGVLSLDEPTQQLDSDNIGYVGNLITHIAKFSRGSGLQVIVVTHADSIQAVFDNVISIG